MDSNEIFLNLMRQQQKSLLAILEVTSTISEKLQKLENVGNSLIDIKYLLEKIVINTIKAQTGENAQETAGDVEQLAFPEVPEASVTQRISDATNRKPTTELISNSFDVINNLSSSSISQLLNQNIIQSDGTGDNAPLLLVKCDYPRCNKLFSRNDLSTHFEIHLNEYPCPRVNCKQIFNNNRYLSKHMERDHKPSGIPIKQERRIFFDSPIAVTRSAEKAKPNKKLDQTENFRNGLKSIIKQESLDEYDRSKAVHGNWQFQGTRQCVMDIVYSPAAAFNCPQLGCDKTYKTERGLEGHIATHSGKVWPCTQSGCGKVYNYERSLKQHLKKVHGIPQIPQSKSH